MKKLFSEHWRRKGVAKTIALGFNSLIFLYRIPLGYYLYHNKPQKRLVIITGTQRSGTTLLKALLGEAPDVSHLSEVSYDKYNWMHRYRAYYEIYKLAPEPIIVLKRPNLPCIPFEKNFLDVRLLITVRNMNDTVQSLLHMTALQAQRQVRKYYKEPWTTEQAARYWAKTNRRIFNNKRVQEFAHKYVRYEALVANPKAVTKEIFTFIESAQKEGVDTYKNSKRVSWKWGTDDGGEKIRSLTVQSPKNNKPITNIADQKLKEFTKRITAQIEEVATQHS